MSFPQRRDYLADRIRRRATEARRRRDAAGTSSALPLSKPPEERRRKLVLSSDSDDEEPAVQMPSVAAAEIGNTPQTTAAGSSSSSFIDSLRAAFRQREGRPLISSLANDPTVVQPPPQFDKGKGLASPSESEGETPAVSDEQNQGQEAGDAEHIEKVNMHEEGSDAGNQERDPSTADERYINNMMNLGYSEGEAWEAYAITQSQQLERQIRSKSNPQGDRVALESMGFEGTRYPHKATMDRMHITRDVDLLFAACGLSKFMSMASPTFKEETLQFLATMQLIGYAERFTTMHEKHGGAYISFIVHQQHYTFSLRQIEELFGFDKGTADVPNTDEDEMDELWNMMTGQETFDSSRSKGNSIRNPCINYMRRAIANVFYARAITGPINLGEMQLLVMSLKEIIGERSDGRMIEGDDCNSSLAYQLVHHFLSFRRRARSMAKRKSSTPICMGGVVYQILRACGVQFRAAECIAPRFMDIDYLRRADILAKKDFGGQLVYNFRHPRQLKARILLPCPELTSLRMGQNADFIPPLDALFDPSQPPSLLPPPAETEDCDPEDYFFEEYTAPTSRQGEAVTKAHEHIGMLQKVNKWLVKKVKKLTKRTRKQEKERELMNQRMAEFEQRLAAISQPAPTQAPAAGHVQNPPRHSTGDTLVYRRRERAHRRSTSSAQLDQHAVEFQIPRPHFNPSSAQLDQHAVEFHHLGAQFASSSGPLDQHAVEFPNPATQMASSSTALDQRDYAYESMLDFGF